MSEKQETVEQAAERLSRALGFRLFTDDRFGKSIVEHIQSLEASLAAAEIARTYYVGRTTKLTKQRDTYFNDVLKLGEEAAERRAQIAKLQAERDEAVDALSCISPHVAEALRAKHQGGGDE